MVTCIPQPSCDHFVKVVPRELVNIIYVNMKVWSMFFG